MLGWRNSIRLDEIFEIIENAIRRKRNIMFVCDYELAEEISKFLDEEYGIFDENTQLCKEDIYEYYVSLYFDINNDDDDDCYEVFCCECARTPSGKFKLNLYEGIIDYYIFLEMSNEEINKKLQGNGTFGLYELLEEDFDGEVDDDSDEIDEDDGFDDGEAEAICDFISKYADRIIENKLCPDCIFEVLLGLYFDAYCAGVRDQKLAMIEQLSQEIDE